MRTGSSHQLGFTLIELVIIIVIIATLWLTASIKHDTTTNLSAPTTQLSNDIRYTQNLAMARNQRYTITNSNAGYIIKNTVTNNIESSITLPTDITTTNFTLTFNTKGMPLDTNNTALNTPLIITISTTKKSHDIIIAPITGQVTP